MIWRVLVLLIVLWNWYDCITYSWADSVDLFSGPDNILDIPPPPALPSPTERRLDDLQNQLDLLQLENSNRDTLPQFFSCDVNRDFADHVTFRNCSAH